MDLSVDTLRASDAQVVLACDKGAHRLAGKSADELGLSERHSIKRGSVKMSFRIEHYDGIIRRVCI